MLDTTLGTVLVSGLASAVVDRDAIRKAVDLLLYNAHTFLQMRRKKLLGEDQVTETPETADQDEKSTESATGGAEVVLGPISQELTNNQNERGVDSMLQINPALDDTQLTFAERELESLLVQLRTHHRMLIIKQEQATLFAEFVPPHMKLAIRNEQRNLVDKLKRIRVIMELVLDVGFPDIEALCHIVENDSNL